MDRTIVSGCDNTMHSCQSHQSGRTPNLSLQLQPPSDLLICLHAYMLVCLIVGMIHAYRQRAKLICVGIFDFSLPPTRTAHTQGHNDRT